MQHIVAFAAAARSEQRRDHTRKGRQGHCVNGDVVTEPLGQIFDGEGGAGSRPVGARRVGCRHPNGAPDRRRATMLHSDLRAAGVGRASMDLLSA